MKHKPSIKPSIDMSKRNLLLTLALMTIFNLGHAQEKRGRIRDFGIQIGILPAGNINANNEVAGVTEGEKTNMKGDYVDTGVTANIPHQENIFQQKVPDAVFVGNGFGKKMGISQIEELG